MIHVKKLFELAQTQKRFSITWIAEDGHKVFVPDAEFTTKDSFHATNRTMNIKCRQSGEIRTVKIDTIVEFNGVEVFI